MVSTLRFKVSDTFRSFLLQMAHPEDFAGATIDNLNVTRYLGIPFAQPPVGDLRFSPPQAITYNASTTINATVIGPACPQPPSTRYGNTSEDCLHLNVYSPSARALTTLNQTATILAGNNSNLTSAYAQGLPVMVWIYGGMHKPHYLLWTRPADELTTTQAGLPPVLRCHTTDRLSSLSLSHRTPL